MKTAIVWFKTDLRIHDNETLTRAIEENDSIIPVYCFDDAHFKKTNFGFQKTGAYRAQFILESVKNLESNLKKLGAGLLILKGNPADEIAKTVLKFKAQKVYAKKEVADEEIQTQNAVEAALWKLHVPLETYSTSTLYHAKDLPFSLKDIPDIFTQFRKKVETESQIRPIFETPKAIQTPIVESAPLPQLNDLGLKHQSINHKAVLPFKGGEDEAMQRLQHYFYETKAILHYKETRNEMIGADYSSKFSAWLSLGCISARTIYHELKKFEAKYEANKSTYWLVFELLWRDYFRFMMKKHHIAFFLQQGLKPSKSKSIKHDEALFNTWKNGKTGVAFVDANMRELKLTGFMSNRGRQNVASFLCHQLKLDWRFGAAYFEEQLIDYDVCSNWGNWSYVAGVGNDPRENRVFNMEKQANEYDKNGNYRALWLHEN
jgi:deoxyribodipyrimidine photo-lyase